jgi:predicted nuclease of predicted toxin-antitoxin system
MRILADESVDFGIVLELRTRGHAVVYVAELRAGLADEMVLAEAALANAILLTEDKDFGDLVFRQRRSTCGVVLVRLHGLAGATKAQIVADFIGEHEQELPKTFAVITPGSLRIRGEGPSV